MAERKKIVKKAKVVSKVAGKAGKSTTVKQSVKQTVKVVIGDLKKAVKRRPAKKPAPGLTRPATGAYSGVSISDRVVIPPFSRADPSLYNKDALLALTNQIEKLTYKGDNPPLNVSGYLGNRTQQRLTFNSNASNEAYPQGFKIEQAGPDMINSDTVNDKRFKRALKRASRKEPSFAGLSNMFQQQQIDRGKAGAKAEQKIEEFKDDKFASIRFLEEPMTETDIEIPEIEFEEEIKAKPRKKISADDALRKMKAIAKKTNK